ncbi:MAG TPA: hypothetical protein VN622_15700 [Clostridia bacterium]|nr:hypothetical protein [Clostridia bacterium]
MAKTRLLIVSYEGLVAEAMRKPTQRFGRETPHQLLDNIQQRASTRVIIFTERHFKRLAEEIEFRPLPEIWGVGGLERVMPDGSYDLPRFDAWQLRGLAESDYMVDKAGLQRWVEHKPGGSALRLNGIEYDAGLELKLKIWPEWSDIAKRYSLALFDLGDSIELRLPARSRAEAIKMILLETPTNVPIAYLGSNQLDAFGFEMSRYRSLNVMVGDQRANTSANVRLRSQDELFAFLQKWMECCTRARNEAIGHARCGLECAKVERISSSWSS